MATKGLQWFVCFHKKFNLGIRNLFQLYIKVLTIQSQHHDVKNIGIQININIRFILNMYFKDSNVVFKTLYLDYIFKCDVFNDV
jgi:hypothetical protein